MANVHGESKVSGVSLCLDFKAHFILKCYNKSNCINYAFSCALSNDALWKFLEQLRKLEIFSAVFFFSSNMRAIRVRNARAARAELGLFQNPLRLTVLLIQCDANEIKTI